MKDTHSRAYNKAIESVILDGAARPFRQEPNAYKPGWRESHSLLNKAGGFLGEAYPIDDEVEEYDEETAKGISESVFMCTSQPPYPPASRKL